MRLVCLFCVVGGLALSAWGQSPSPVAPLRQAQDQVNSGHFDEALRMLDTLAAEQPEPVGVEYLRGTVFYQQGKMVEAATAFAKAVAQDPKNLEAMQMQGVSLFRAGKPAAAVPLLERARSSVSSANVDPDYVLGLCYLDTGRYDDARRAFGTQYGFTPDSAQAYLLAARMELRREYLPIAESVGTKSTRHSIPVFRVHIFCSARSRSPAGNGPTPLLSSNTNATLIPLTALSTNGWETLTSAPETLTGRSRPWIGQCSWNRL